MSFRSLCGLSGMTSDLREETMSEQSIGTRVAREDRKRWLALYVLCLGVLMELIDTTIVNVAFPSIRTDLGFSQTSLAWVINGYLLTFGGFLLLGGRLGDLYGHRRLFVSGIATFNIPLLRCR